jgi:biotin operon repressor
MGCYVVSEDICVLLDDWAQRRGFTAPAENFFRELRQAMKNQLAKIFGAVEFVPAAALSDGLDALAKRHPWPVVSLDKSYFFGRWQLEINRAVDARLNDQPDQPRFGCQSVEKQINVLRRAGLKVVTLVDDVIFTGQALAKLLHQLQRAGIEVETAIAGIAIKDGIRHLNQHGLEVEAVCVFEEVVDEICERDFYPGVPYCGRLVTNQMVETGAPYLLPFGQPQKWASIPLEHCAKFSRFCLEQSLELWREIERRSGRPVLCSDLSRRPLGAPLDGYRFADYLGSLL